MNIFSLRLCIIFAQHSSKRNLQANNLREENQDNKRSCFIPKPCIIFAKKYSFLYISWNKNGKFSKYVLVNKNITPDTQNIRQSFLNCIDNFSFYPIRWQEYIIDPSFWNETLQINISDTCRKSNTYNIL